MANVYCPECRAYHAEGPGCPPRIMPTCVPGFFRAEAATEARPFQATREDLTKGHYCTCPQHDGFHKPQPDCDLTEERALAAEIASLLSRITSLEAERDGALALLAEAREWLRNCGVHAHDCDISAAATGPCTCGLAHQQSFDDPIPERGARILEVISAAQVVRSKHGHHPRCDSNDLPIRPCDCGYQALCDALLALRHLDATPVKAQDR